MPLTISFLFHFNQDIGPYTLFASRASYQGLIAVLRKHKNKKFNIHVSGTLIESLSRFDPGTLKELVSGVKEEQFEILGSTYAQNVLAATDELSNRYQIEQHLEIIQKTFGVCPKGFWIPERCWKQKFVKLLSDFGYTYTLIEKQTLEKIKLQNYHLPYKTSYQARSIAIVQDDEHFKQLVNFAVWCDPLPSSHSLALSSEVPSKALESRLFDKGSGKPETFQPALSHLEALAWQKDAARSIAVYAEDAEASGLWGVPFGAFPQPVWKNWDRLLHFLEQDKRFQISSIGDFLKRTKIEKEIGPIPDGQAEWMVQSLRKKDAPYHEDGYSDWFDFVHRSPKIRKYRKFFAKLAREIQKAETMARRCQKSRFIGTAISDKPHPNCSRRFSVEFGAYLQEAKLLLCRSQYEFGCIGIGKKNYPPFEKARECLIPLTRFWEILSVNSKNLNSLLRKGWQTKSGRVFKKAANQKQKRDIKWFQCLDSQWKKFKKIVPVKKCWFKKFIADWIFDVAPAKVVQYSKR